jgi:hypothetical protein
MNSETEINKKTIRRYDHDWLKVLAIMLIFVYHAAAPFHPWFDWHISSGQKSEFLGLISAAGYGWPLPLFMLLAGAGSWFALQKRSYSQYASERFTRILLPLILGMLILIPPQVYMERLQKRQFFGSFLEYLPHALDGGAYPRGNISAGQFWFLFYLIFYALLAIPIFAFLRSETGKRLLSKLAHFCRYRGAILLFAVPLILGQIYLGWRYPETHNPIDDWMFHWQLFLVFIFGFILYSDDRFEEAINRNWVLILILAIVSTGGMFAIFFAGPRGVSDSIMGYGLDFPAMNNSYKAYYILGSTLLRLNTWTFILLLLWLAKRFLSAKNRALGYAGPAAYPVFMLHQTIIIIVAFYVLQQRHMGILRNFLVILSTSLVITLVIYELARRWRLTRYVIGAKPSAKPTHGPHPTAEKGRHAT